MENSEVPAWAKKLMEDQAAMIEQLKGLLETKPASQKASESTEKGSKGKKEFKGIKVVPNLSDDNIKSMVNEMMR